MDGDIEHTLILVSQLLLATSCRTGLNAWSEPRLNRTGNSAYFEPFLPYT